MSYSNKSSGNITIIKPNKCYSKVSNNIILDSRISHTSLRIALFLNLKHDNWFFTKEELMEALSVSKNVYSHSINELKEYGYLEVNKVSKGKGKGFSYQYSINTEGYTDPRKWDVETIRDPINDTYTDPRKWDVDKPSNNQDLTLEPSNSLISTTSQKVGSIYNTDINNKTINNTKEKNYKKESEVKNDMDKKKQLVKRLNSLGIDNTDNLFKYNSLDEIEQHIKWLPYRISINTATEDQIKYKLIDSIRYKEGTPKELKDIELTDKLKLACRLIKTNGTSKGDMIQALIKKLVKMKELHSKKLDIHIKETIELETLQRNLLKQAPLTVKEKGEIQEKETELFEQHKQNISNELKILRDSLDIKELFKSSLDTLNSQEGLKILLDKEIALYGSLDSLFNRLEIFILKETYKECA